MKEDTKHQTPNSFLDSSATTGRAGEGRLDRQRIRAELMAYPTLAPTFASTYDWPQDESGLQGMLLVLLFAAGIFTVGLAYNYVMSTSETATFKGFLMQVLCLYAIILTLLSLSLMLQWTSSRNTSLDYGFLNEPDYSSNLFAYHPLLMVAGFFLFQVFAVLSWYIVPSYILSKISHFSLHTAALICMCQSLQCIRLYCIDKKIPSTVTLHSWIGIICVTLFLFNYIYGLYMALYRVSSSANKPGFLLACTQTDLVQYLSRHLRQYINWFKLYHKLSGVVVLVFTALSIVTGISIRTTQFCWYKNEIGRMTVTPDMVNNPGDYYANIPLSCQIANGLGLSVILCTACMIAFVVLRNLPDSFVPHFPNGDDEEDGGEKTSAAAGGDSVKWTDNELSSKQLGSKQLSSKQLGSKQLSSKLSVYRNASKVELGLNCPPSIAL